VEKQQALAGIYKNMKILYGIQLTGNGHLTRSVQIIRELKKRGHEVDIITVKEGASADEPQQDIRAFHKEVREVRLGDSAGIRKARLFRIPSSHRRIDIFCRDFRRRILSDIPSFDIDGKNLGSLREGRKEIQDILS